MSCIPSFLGSPAKELARISILEGWEECSELPLLLTLSLGWTRVPLSSLCGRWLCALLWITLWPALLLTDCLGGSLHGVCATPGTPWVYLCVCHGGGLPQGPVAVIPRAWGAEEAVVSICSPARPSLHCSAAQRSAQELPQVEAYSPSACSVRGGEELVLTGSNFLPDSKVVFIERGPGECSLGREGQAGRAGTGR